MNWYGFLAGTMARETPDLLSRLTDRDVDGSVCRVKDILDRGDSPMMTLSLDDEVGALYTYAFAAEYRVFFKGLEDTITGPEGLYFMPPGRVDIRLERADGHSLSVRIGFDKLGDKLGSVRDVAQKRMGCSLKDELLRHPNGCVPPLSSDIGTYLASYQRMPPTSEVYVGLPRGGAVAPNHLLLWRREPAEAVLKRMQSKNVFPVRRAVTTGTGVSFSRAAYTLPPISQGLDSAEGTGLVGSGTVAPGVTGQQLGDTGTDLASPSVTPVPSGLPMMVHLRGHYNRLMVLVETHYATNITPSEGKDDVGPPSDAQGRKVWADKYQTKHDAGNRDHELLEGDGNVIVRKRRLRQLVHLGVGVVLGRNVAAGFSPRAYRPRRAPPLRRRPAV